jgi:hypothetical protein
MNTDRPIRLGSAVPRAEGYRAQPPDAWPKQGRNARTCAEIAHVAPPPIPAPQGIGSGCVGCGIPWLGYQMAPPPGCGHPSGCYMLVPGAAYGAGAQGASLSGFAASGRPPVASGPREGAVRASYGPVTLTPEQAEELRALALEPGRLVATPAPPYALPAWAERLAVWEGLVRAYNVDRWRAEAIFMTLRPGDDPAGIITGMSRAGREPRRCEYVWESTEGYREVWNSRDGWLVDPSHPVANRVG